MYIKKLVYQNVGPIEDVTIEPGFNADGTPKPLILVGENGTGKSTILSNIVDSFYEIAGKAYRNVNENIESGGYQYFKSIIPGEIHIGKQEMFSCVLFKSEGKVFPYFFKSGNLKEDFVSEKLPGVSLSGLSWKNSESFKGVSIKREEVEKIFGSNVICYFGPDRYEKPEWMGNKYYENSKMMHFAIEQKIFGTLDNEITVSNVAKANLRWLLDIIADSREDFCNEAYLHNNKIYNLIRDPANLIKLSETYSVKQTLEKIMSSILGIEIQFALNSRKARGSRFLIRRVGDKSPIVHSFDSLSTGQLALFNMFATIIRYADNNNANNGLSLEGITGIVVIDEIELHLHSKLQIEVLPKLIRLFPKIQFIITSHAPLFLLGMEDTFEEGGFDVYELPDAKKITAERFSEFKNAFRYYQDTSAHEKEISETLRQASNGKKAIVITEGPADWKHMKAAYQALKKIPEYSDTFKNLDFEFLEYEDVNSNLNSKYKIKMGCDELKKMCKAFSTVPQTTRYIFIADSDVKSSQDEFSVADNDFKTWGNNVYSFVIPTPKSRGAKGICIEHLYTDAEITTEYCCPKDHVKRRLYLGNEFSKAGISKDRTKICHATGLCGEESIKIIDGSDNKKVVSITGNQEINYALPKNQFASLVLKGTPPFDNFDFKNFLPIFEIIKKIVNLD